MKVSKSMYSKVSRSALSILLSIIMVISILPSVIAKAADTTEESYPYVVFTYDSGNSLNFCKSNLTVNGDIHSNGKLTINASNANINGECGAVEGIDKGHGNFNVSKQVSNPETVDMISIPNKVKTTYFTSNCDTINNTYTKSDVNVNLNRSVYAEKEVHLSGNISLNCCVGSSGNIILDGNTLNSNNTVLYSENGDITINNGNATVNGLIYAPNGKVTVKGQNFQVNGAIIAKEVKIDSGNVNINRNDSVAKFIGNTSENNTQLELYAYGEYIKDSNIIMVSWSSTNENGQFEVMTSTDGNKYGTIATLTNKNSYTYSPTDSPEKLYFKVRQTLKDGKTVESNPFVMVKTDSGYELQDTDGDGLADIYEKWLGTDPKKADTDGDGLNDYQEIYLTCTDPLKTDTDGNGISDANEDPDQDGLTNLEEMKLGTNPQTADTDNDGLKDGDEVHKYKTDPLKYDTDGDGISDGDEIKLGLDPNKTDSNGDGIPDNEEKIEQTLKHSISDKNSAINEIDVSFKGTGCIDSTTSVNSVKDIDMMSTNVVGLMGEPFEFKTSSDFSEATITFKINKANLKNTLFSNLAILWYDETNQIYRLLDTQLDEKNSTVSSKVTHFSKYMVIDKEKWFEAWHKELNYYKNQYKDCDTVLALDCSGSMYDNDPITSRTHSVDVGSGHYETITDHTCGRIEAAENYITTMGSNDKVAIVAFDYSTNSLCEMTSDKNLLISSLQNIYSDGGTSFDSAIQASINKLSACKDNNRKVIILLSDGQDEISDSILEKAKESGITIYTVGLGSDVYEYPLKDMASSTGGEYYKAAASDDLSDLFTKIGIGKDIDNTDTDGDGLADIFEISGMKLANGRIIYTDPQDADTDRDGLKDGEEISPVYKTMSGAGIPSDILSKTSGVYFVMKSDPTLEDSDFDGYKDNVDPRPLISDVTKYSLFNSNVNTDFVTIYNDDGGTSYGGDQDWFKGYNALILNGGCGTVAACNVLAYFELNNPKFANVTKLPNIKHITKKDYMEYIKRMANYIPPIIAIPYIPIKVGNKIIFVKTKSANGTWGVWPDEFISGIEKYCSEINVNHVNEQGREFAYRKKYISKLIAENLTNNVPITICTGIGGSNTYYDYGTKNVNPYGHNVTTHWVDITEFKIDDITGKSTLTISTWGYKLDLDLDEFLNNEGLGGGIYEFSIS